MFDLIHLAKITFNHEINFKRLSKNYFAMPVLSGILINLVFDF
jgi:hypothetical protein